jgi:hypothetical protein
MIDDKIIRLIQGKDRRILEAEAELLEGLTPVELKIFDALKNQISKMNQTGGKIDFDSKNVNLVNELDKILVKTIQKSDYPGTVKKYLQNFDDVTDFNEMIHEELNGISPEEFRKNVDPFKKQIVEDTLQGLTGSGVSTNFVEPVRQELFKNIVAGTNSIDVEKALRDFIQGQGDKAGTLKRYITQVSRDALNQYEGQINSRIAEEFDLDAFQYVGSLIDDSRPQCIRWTGKEVILKKDLESEISWAFNNGSGMVPGTNANNFAVFRGGYNCRHAAIPFKLTRREKERLEGKKPEEPKPVPVEKKIKDVEKKIEEKAKAANKKENKSGFSVKTFHTNAPEELSTDVQEVFSFANNLVGFANQGNRPVTLRTASESTKKGSELFVQEMNKQKGTSLTDWAVGTISDSSNGVCYKTRRGGEFVSVHVKYKAGDVAEFKKIDLTLPEDPEKFAEEFGLTKLETRGGGYVYTRGRQTVLIKDPGSDSLKWWTVSGRSSAIVKNQSFKNIAPTITHESAHAIAFNYDPGNQILRQKFRSKGMKLKDSVTEYGASDLDEFFAESFTCYVYDNKFLKDNHPKIFDFVEDYLNELQVDLKTVKIAK